MKITSFSAMAVLLAFIMLLSGCKGNADKPSVSSSSDATESMSVSSETIENQLKSTVQSKRVTEESVYEFVGNDKQNDRNYLLTISVPKDVIIYPLSILNIGESVCFSEALTYTEDTANFCELQVKPATCKTMDELLEKAKHNYEISDRLYYKLYDNGIIEKKEPSIDWMVETTRYFDCGYVLTAFFSNDCGYEKTIYDMLSAATLTITDREVAPVKLVSGSEAQRGIPSKKYNEYEISYKRSYIGDEYDISFSLPDGVCYIVNQWGEPKTDSNICSITLLDGTGYSKEGYPLSFAYTDLFSSDEHDLSNTDKYTELEKGIYMYEYTPVVEGAYSHRVYFKVINNEYMVYIDETIAPYGEMDELKKRVSFDFFKTLKISKK